VTLGLIFHILFNAISISHRNVGLHIFVDVNNTIKLINHQNNMVPTKFIAQQSMHQVFMIAPIGLFYFFLIGLTFHVFHSSLA
jgi:hypothetical protein